MPAAKLTPEAWEEVRRASEAGVDDETLSQDYGVTKVNIRERRKREKWLSNYRMSLEADKQSKEFRERQLRQVQNGTISQVSQSVEIIGKSIAEIRENHPLKMAKWLESQVSSSLEQGLVSAPRDWKELNTADTMLRRSLGLDKPQTNVQVNLWDTSSSNSSPNPSQMCELEED